MTHHLHLGLDTELHPTPPVPERVGSLLHFPEIRSRFLPQAHDVIVALPPGTQGEVFIVELSGRVVFQSGWSGPLIATDHLASGIYVVRFFDHTSRRVRAERFVKYR